MVHTRRFRSPSFRSLTGTACTLAAPLAALLLNGCAGLPDSSRPSQINPAITRASITLSDDVYASMGYRRSWTGFAEVGKRAGVAFFRADDELVIIQDGASTITALDVSTGARRWRNTLATPLSKFVGIVRFGKLIVVCGEGGAYFIDPATGSTVDRQTFKRVVSTPPLQVGSSLLFGTGTGRVFSHDLASGLPRWENTVGGAIESAGIVVGGSVAFVSTTGNISFLDPASNSLRGTGGIYSGTNLPLAASNRLLFIASQDQSLYAFSPTSQLPIWQVRTEAPLTHAPIYHAGVVYCTIAKRGLTAFDARTGDENWAAPGVTGKVIGTRAGRLIVWNGSVVTVLDAADGSVFTELELTGVDHLVMDEFSDGNLYATSDEGLVIRLVPNS